MSNLSGPELDKLVSDCRAWYLDMRKKLLEAFEEGPYTYGSVKLAPAEQLSKYLAMTAQDWELLRQQRLKRYQGQVDAIDLANQDLAKYRDNMERLRARLGGGI